MEAEPFGAVSRLEVAPDGTPDCGAQACQILASVTIEAPSARAV